MTISKQLVFEKMTISKEYLIEAREVFSSMTNEEILQSKPYLHTLERYLQLIVDAILDINNHIIKELDLEPAKDLKSTFNILADNKKFLEKFRKHNGDFDEYFRQITSYLNKADL